MPKVLPVPDSVSAFFWEGAARSELLIQRCAPCGEFQYPPMPVCESCQSRDLVPTQVSGRASLYALTVLHQAFLPEFAEDLPYTLALVDLDDAPGVRLLTNVVQVAPQQLSIGDPLEVLFEQRGDTALPMFRPRQDVPA
ncbi:OB-fold domain-containing protein [Streptomyces sp. NPDC051572]|uniref:Zn-ribbon domain-containing OB-fold protein n=1 Tax=unclassified Streptomyces TaxID=2593676 RepID=UPI00344D382F